MTFLGAIRGTNWARLLQAEVVPHHLLNGKASNLTFIAASCCTFFTSWGCKQVGSQQPPLLQELSDLTSSVQDYDPFRTRGGALLESGAAVNYALVYNPDVEICDAQEASDLTFSV